MSGSSVPVGGDAVVDPAVVRRHADRQRVAGQQRRHRVGLDHPGAGGVQRELRAGHVGDRQVEAAPQLGRPRPATRARGTSWARSPRCRRAGWPRRRGRSRVCASNGVGHLVQPDHRARLADRQVDEVAGDLGAQRGRLELVVDHATSGPRP